MGRGAPVQATRNSEAKSCSSRVTMAMLCKTPKPRCPLVFFVGNGWVKRSRGQLFGFLGKANIFFNFKVELVSRKHLDNKTVLKENCK